MPDHGVGGVDGLVGNQSRQPQQRQPEHRRHHPIGEILRAGFDRGAAHAGFIQLFRDHVRRSLLPHSGGDEAAFGERLAYPRDMLIEASLRDEDGGDERQRHIAHRKLLQGH